MDRKTDWIERDRIVKDHPELVFTMDQIRDVCDLIKAKKWPDINYSDAECCLWSLLKGFKES